MLKRWRVGLCATSAQRASPCQKPAVDLGYTLGGLALGVACTALAIYLMGGEGIRVDSIGGSRGRPLGRPAR